MMMSQHQREPTAIAAHQSANEIAVVDEHGNTVGKTSKTVNVSE